MINRRETMALLGAAAVAAGATRTGAAERARPATYVLVHGAYSGGWTWQRMTPHMQGFGHRIYTPTLTGQGEREHLLRPDTDLDTHIADIVAVLKWEDLTNVILVGHSYGGMVISGVADRARDRIGHLVYLDAARPHDGQSLADISPGFISMAKKEFRSENGVEVTGGRGGSAQAASAVSENDPEIAHWRRTKTSPMPWKALVEPLRMADEAAVDRIPRTMINTSTTMKGRDTTARARALDAERVWEIDTTHQLQLTKPRETAELLLRLAAL